MYFNVITNSEGNQTVTVEGAGVNATVIQPDIAQMNGYVHIINRVLGVPFGTVADKLASDPMLKYELTNFLYFSIIDCCQLLSISSFVSIIWKLNGAMSL